MNITVVKQPMKPETFTQSAADEEWSQLPTDVQNHILEAALAARQIARNLTREHWLQVGRGLLDIRDQALRRSSANHIHHPFYRRFHRLYMSRVPDLVELDRVDHAGCQHAMWMVTNWERYVDDNGTVSVSSWLAAKDAVDHIRRLNHPSAIHRAYVTDNTPKPQGLAKASTKKQRLTELVADRDRENTELRQQISELETTKPMLALPAPAVEPEEQEDLKAAKMKIEKLEQRLENIKAVISDADERNYQLVKQHSEESRKIYLLSMRIKELEAQLRAKPVVAQLSDDQLRPYHNEWQRRRMAEGRARRAKAIGNPTRNRNKSENSVNV
jgi:hypothetical protein